MPSKYARTLLLSITILAVYAWTSSSVLSLYNLQLTGVLVLLYFGSRLIFRSVRSSLSLTAVMLISVTLLLIFSSGGINSPLFFILDFLLFAIALLLAPYEAAVASLILLIVFLWQNSTQQLTSHMIIDLMSLILITPLAVIFGKSYLQNLRSKGKISILKEAIKDEQTDSLLWITTTAKPSLASILNSLTDLVLYLNTKGQLTLIPKALIEKLKTIQKDLISLYASTGSLEKSIEDSSDNMEL